MVITTFDNWTWTVLNAFERRAAHRKSDQSRDDLCAGEFRKCAWNGQRLAPAIGYAAACKSKSPTATPDGWRSQLNNIARWITKIDRTSTFWPVHLSFDGDSSLTQLLPPRFKLFRLCSECDMASTRSSVGRNISTRCGTLARIKDQQNSIATAENYSQISSSDNLQTYGIAIKPFRSSQIFGIQDCLKDSAWSHRRTFYSAPPNEKEISHGRVSWQTRRTYFEKGPLASSAG